MPDHNNTYGALDTAHDILQDTNLLCLGNYIKDELNRRNTIDNTIIVRTVYNYDAYNIPISDLPVLKLSRQSSFYLPNNKRKSSIELQYGLALPEHERLLPYLNWVDYNINQILSVTTQLKNIFVEETSKRCQYRTLMSEMGIPVYSFLRFSFTITEGSY